MARVTDTEWARMTVLREDNATSNRPWFVTRGNQIANAMRLFGRWDTHARTQVIEVLIKVFELPFVRKS